MRINKQFYTDYSDYKAVPIYVPLVLDQGRKTLFVVEIDGVLNSFIFILRLVDWFDKNLVHSVVYKVENDIKTYHIWMYNAKITLPRNSEFQILR